MEAQSRQLSEIVINPDLVEALEGIEEFSHIMVIFWAHRTLEGIEKTLKVHPLGSDDFPLVGVFATRSPARPNNILVTAAKLLAREGNILRVTGLDALDGSPVLDIKPYYAERNIKEIHVPAWMQTIDAQYDRHQP